MRYGATSFFEQQEKARRLTTRLVLLFLLAVIAIFVGVYLAVIFVLRAGSGHINAWWNPQIFWGVTVSVGAIITIGTLYKMYVLRRGGAAVAQALGGRVIDPDTKNPLERRLLNVIEEMSIASGVPVPDVYLLENEDGINAFAAGYTPSNAVIGVTRGCIEQLSRDELQGVIAHEFSHILNGDMRLNLRLIGILNGILAISIIGYSLLRSSTYRSYSYRSKRSNTSALALVGLVIMVLGYIGVFFGKLIKAAVSRQREFLADASAVQFTRNPDTIGGALKKIAGFTSKISSPKAEEASHMFFADGLAASFFALFATHPPILERIRRIDPSFDGTLPEPSYSAKEEIMSSAVSEMESATRMADQGGVSSYLSKAKGMQFEITPQDSVKSIGAPQNGHLLYAADLLNTMPQQIKELARSTLGARLMIYILLISEEPEIRVKQITHLEEHDIDGVVGRLKAVEPYVKSISRESRLAVIDMAIPALRRLSQRQYENFQENIAFLIQADNKISLFELILVRILMHSVEVHYYGTKGRSPYLYRSVASAKKEIEILLSALANEGAEEDEDKAEAAFLKGAKEIGLEVDIVRLKKGQYTVEQLDIVLSELEYSLPDVKEKIVRACTAVIAYDGKVTQKEAELLRAVCESLNCPIPPFLPASDQD
ncbi:MAG: hypothetical protein D6808_05850 [Candidatus Dadabacteria bacterium]|nr:MAG: hypothetical protein D6808_05850 [Candidatus Dadabacteria bacterium]